MRRLMKIEVEAPTAKPNNTLEYAEAMGQVWLILQKPHVDDREI